MSNGNNLELNKGDQFIIGLDISGSMGVSDCPGGMKRYDYTLETCRTFCGEAAKWDPDGVSFYLFGASVYAHRDLKPDEIEAKLKNVKLEGATQTHLAVRKAWEEHVEKKNAQTFFMLFTDGQPSDPDALKQVIIDITKAVKDPAEFRIQLLTVGERTPELTAYLTSLDDTLTQAGALHDIVDVKRMEDVDFMKAVSEALTD